MDTLVISVHSLGKDKKTDHKVDFNKINYSPVGILENTNIFKKFNHHLAFETCIRVAESINMHNNKVKSVGDKATFRIGATYNHTGFNLSAIINTLSGPFTYREGMSREKTLKYIEPITDLLDSIIFELNILYPFSKLEDQSLIIDKKGGIVINLVDMVDLSHIPEQNISGFNERLQ